MKLSKTQQDVVLCMADGARLYLSRIPESHYRLWRGSHSIPVTADGDIETLLQRGGVKRETNAWLTAEYTLTPAGREEASRIRQEAS